MHIDKIIKREVFGILFTVIILLVLFIGISYAVFFSIDEGESSVISIGDIDVKFCKDTSCGEEYANYGKVIGLNEVDGVSTPAAIYPYETDALALETTPYIFNIENTGDYKVYLNTFLEEDLDFVPPEAYQNYTSITELFSNYVKIGVGQCDGGVADTSNVDIYTYGELVDYKIIDNDEIDVGDNKTYCVWTWLSNESPNEVQETYFVANLNFTAEYKPVNPWYAQCNNSSTLGCTILANNKSYPDNVNSEFVKNETPGIDFSQISGDTNGKGLYFTSLNTDEDGDGTNGKVFYFRGEVENNYLVFANFCWRIVRTNEDGSVKLRYGGAATASGDTYTCPTTGNPVHLDVTTGVYNSTKNATKYVGYTYGEANTNSTIKTTIDTWYSNNIESQGESVTKNIANTIFCNDRTTYKPSNLVSDNTFYQAHNRLLSNKSPQFACPNPATDGYTLSKENGGSDGYGNNLLTYPVALLIADEVAYAGGLYNISNEIFYLFTGEYYWTMSPYNSSESDAAVFYVGFWGNLYANNVNITTPVVVPALSLVPEATVSSGTGLYNDPYLIN